MRHLMLTADTQNDRLLLSDPAETCKMWALRLTGED